MSLEIEYDDGLEIAHATRVRQHGGTLDEKIAKLRFFLNSIKPEMQIFL